jgi:hypothetical protein
MMVPSSSMNLYSVALCKVNPCAATTQAAAGTDPSRLRRASTLYISAIVMRAVMRA